MKLYSLTCSVQALLIRDSMPCCKDVYVINALLESWFGIWNLCKKPAFGISYTTLIGVGPLSLPFNQKFLHVRLYST